MNTANKLTLFRVALIPVFLVILYLRFSGSEYVALAIFVIAGATDFIDGYIARSRNQVTDFGKFMDPLADKVLVISAMLWFVQEGRFPAWAAIIVITREFAVTALRLIAADGGVVIAAGYSGKIKTVCTMFGLIIMFLPVPDAVVTICTVVIIVTTIYSGAEYFIKNRKLINTTK